MAEQVSPPPQESLRDQVTQLYNRRHLLRRLQEMMAKSDRQKERMALVIWDIEGFGQFNNEFGQGEGDEFLRRVAATIRQALRVYDEAFRSGADEFCAILAPADEKIAGDVMTRVRRIVSTSLFEAGTPYGTHKFAIWSAAVFFPSEEKLPEALLHAAEQALYQSQISDKKETPT
jgi:diguanylate cyclase (GGDEF)-like protein